MTGELERAPAVPTYAAEAGPIGSGAPDVAPAPPPPRPFPEPGARRVVGVAFDALVGASAELRRASFYVGLLVLGLVAPYVLLSWAFEVAASGLSEEQLIDLLFRSSFAAPFSLATMFAGLGVALAVLESRNVAALIVAAHVAGTRVTVREAVQRSRTVFWRTVAATLLVNVPLYIVQAITSDRIAPAFGVDTEITVVSASILAALVFAPLTYAIVGIVVGDVGARESLRRSVRLFRARPILGAVVALITAAAQYLVPLGLGAGLGLVFGAADALGIGTGSGTPGIAAATAVLIALTFAFGTLVFTVSAVAVAPQVVGFLALTRATPALDAIERGRDQAPPDPSWPYRPPAPDFRWLTRPLRVAIAIGAVLVVAGINAIGG
jgi:hypothetical protein